MTSAFGKCASGFRVQGLQPKRACRVFAKAVVETDITDL